MVEIFEEGKYNNSKESKSSAEPSSTSGDCYVKLSYQRAEEGKTIGMYVDRPNTVDDMIDEYDETEVKLIDARALEEQPVLDKHGFELRQFPTKVKNFFDDDEVREVYYPEVEQLMKEATGCTKVFVFDHTLRTSNIKAHFNLGKKNTAAGSVSRVHGDYTDQSAPFRFEQLTKMKSYTGMQLDEDEVKELMKKRFAFLNVWRNCNDYPVSRRPLCCCDTRSVRDEEIVNYELRYSDRTGYNSCVTAKHSQDHKWHYYSDMSKHEGLLFWTYDKKKDGPRFTQHCAFDHPGMLEDAPERASMECRAIVCFDQ